MRMRNGFVEACGADEAIPAVLRTIFDPKVAAGVIRLEEPSVDPTETVGDYAVIGLQSTLVFQQTHRDMSRYNALPLEDMRLSIEETWQRKQLKGGVSKLIPLTSISEQKQLHIDMIMRREEEGIICPLVVLTCAVVGTAELRAETSAAVTSPELTALETRKSLKDRQAEVASRPRRFHDLPEGIMINPHDVGIIPTLPYPAAHATRKEPVPYGQRERSAQLACFALTSS